MKMLLHMVALAAAIALAAPAHAAEALLLAPPVAGEPPLIVAQGLPGRLPGTLPGQQPHAAPKPAPAQPSSPSTGADMPAACCEIIAIDNAKGLVRASERASGRIVEFKVGDSRALKKLSVGQAVRVNFDAKQVSLDGKTMCCAVTSVTSAPTTASKAPAQPSRVPGPLTQGPIGRQAPEKTPGTPSQLPGMGPDRTGMPGGPRGPRGPAGPAGAAGAAGAAGTLAKAGESPRDPRDAKGAGRTRKTYPLPTATAGAPEPRTGKGRALHHSAVRGAKHLRGLDEIESSSLPESAKIVMMMHAGTLPENASDHYIVNPQMAAEWAKTHKVPDDMKPKKKKKKKKKCDWNHSGGCADKVKKTTQDLWDSASEDWKRAWKANTKNLQESWDELEECFKDHVITVSDIPVKFKLAPEFSINLEKSSSGGSSSGKAKGTLTIGLPVEADFRAEVKLFYIPCLPFVIRPRSISADGSMAVAANLGANLTATGTFNAHYTIPPGGGPAIPIVVIPIIVGGIPVATLDVALYVDGTVNIGGEGQLDGRFRLVAPYKSNYDFDCSGRGCSGKMKNVPVPTTTTENVVLKGAVHVQPKIYTALQLSLNFDALSARAGPQPFLYGEVRGCSATAAMQNTSGQSTAQEFHALSADLDWGIEFRAEALVAGEQVESYEKEVMKRKHIWFSDIAPGGSTALSPGVTGPVQLAVGISGQYQLQSRPCHPYSEAVDYRVTWAGGATATSNPPPGPRAGSSPPGKKSSSSTACSWGAGQGTCTLKPGDDASLHLAWPQPGSYTVRVTPLRDKHGREFKQDRATQVNVNVQ